MSGSFHKTKEEKERWHSFHVPEKKGIPGKEKSNKPGESGPGGFSQQGTFKQAVERS